MPKKIVLKDAMVKGFQTKTNSVGRTIGKLTIEIETENPDDDFFGIAGLQKVYCTCTLKEREPEQEPDDRRYGG
ncbi:MAG TPA: hypothetical protein PKV86_08835 [Syntrophobacteraceae bacterium]|jgi:hypothetical protein|nr:hypothetical protein [Syntrophobacteraceae bacterium]